MSYARMHVASNCTSVPALHVESDWDVDRASVKTCSCLCNGGASTASLLPFQVMTWRSEGLVSLSEAWLKSRATGATVSNAVSNNPVLFVALLCNFLKWLV